MSKRASLIDEMPVRNGNAPLGWSVIGFIHS